MTLATTSNTVVCQGNGATTSFDFTFPVPLASELYVYYTDANGSVTLLSPTVYSTTGIGTADGGSVNYPLSGSPIASGTTLTIQRIVPYQQLTSLVNQSGYYPNVVENALDYLTMQTQQLAQGQQLSIQVPLAASVADLVLPGASGRALGVVGFDAYGNAIIYPLPASVGAGTLTSEGPFVNGVDFVAGTTTTLTLSKNYGSTANVDVHFDGVYQGTDQYTLSGTQIVFTSPIPVGTNKVYVVGGTTLSAYIPATGSVGPNQLAAGAVGDVAVSPTSALYRRLTEVVSVMDPAYGAKGDAIIDPTTGAYVSGTDDTAAIQACLNANARVHFPAGYKFYVPGGLTVPASCVRIDGEGAMMIGPGKFSSVNGFTFNNRYQGGTIIVTSERYELPSLSWYQYAVYMNDSAFLNISSDAITQCTVAYFMTVSQPVPADYDFELNLYSRFISKCQNSSNTSGGAFYLQATGNSTNAFQGCRMEAFSIDDVFAAVYQEFSSTGTNGNINNQFVLTNVDQSQYVVYNTQLNCTSQNVYEVPQGITSPGNAQMFHNCQPGTDMYKVGAMCFADPTFTALSNFQYNGWGSRPSCTQFTAGVVTVYVSQTGSDTTGTGNSSAPFATIQKAINVLQGVDLMGLTAYIALRDGTYNAGGTYAAIGGANCSGTIAIIGDQATPANVVVNGTIAANGAGAHISVSGMTLANGGLLSQNGAMVDLGPSVVFAGFAGGDHMQADLGGIININSSYSAYGSATNHLHARRGGAIAVGATVSGTFTGSPAYTNVALSESNAQMSMSGITYTGAGVSGTKYTCKNGGGIDTNGGGASFFPGTVAGTATSPGWYA